MCNVAVSTADQHGWDVELFPGVNGLEKTIDDFGLFANTENAKCREAMKRPGVQGCFISHWLLWQHCVSLNEPVGIFEHDVEFLSSPTHYPDFDHVLKLEGFLKKKQRPAGEWYEGARAYFIKPAGAKQLLDWAAQNGALPADVAIGLDVVDITLDLSNKVQQHLLYGKTDKRENSFTWNLERMT
jgi:GR25 family glycosyltransferase involved in LPS biosynthesis